jgi:cyclopropane fatty-acyl-phospholipid synthase-like methyltransferase
MELEGDIPEAHRVVAQGYDAIASAYADASLEARTPGSYYRGFVDACVARVPPGGPVLDLGCGAGILAADLAARARVVGVDLSREQLRLARERVPSASLVLADISRFEVRERSLAAVAAFWSIIHVRRERHAALFARIRTWLRPGGFLFGTLGTGDNPDERDENFFGAPMTWSHFDMDTNLRLLVDAGFELESAEAVEDMDEEHLWVVARA